MSASRSRITASDGQIFDFITLKGLVDKVGQNVEDITRPGIDGHALRLTGRRGRPFEMTGIRDFVNGAAAKAGYEALQSIRGLLCTVLDDYSDSHTLVMMLDVRREAEAPNLTQVGGLSTAPGAAVVLMRFKFTMLDTNIG